MYEIFGEFNSAEEINKAAEGLKLEGDIENIKILSKENGIQEAMTDLYMEGATQELTDFFNAAVGKLNIELEELKNNRMPVRPIVDYLCNLCMKQEFAEKVRCKKKNLKACIQEVEDKAKKECERTEEPYIADLTVFNWARDYYKSKEAAE